MNNDIYSYQPYTYLIGWSKTKVFYYGVEYGNKSKIANPKNLWTTYFTSSDYVARYREINGEPDIIQVRKIFDDPMKALEWENKVLKRLNVLKSPEKWLNRNIAGVVIMDDYIAQKISNTMKGIMPKVPWWNQPKSEKQLKATSERMKTNNPSCTPEARKRKSLEMKSKSPFFKGKKHSEETKQGWRIKRKGKKRTAESIEKQKKTNTGKVFVFKEKITKRIPLDEVEYYINNGWERGMAKRK